MQLSGSLASLNKAAVQAAKQGNHQEAVVLYDQLFAKLSAQHLTHPKLFVAYSNRAACHLALGQFQRAAQDAQQCMKLLTAAAARAGLATPSRHPHWAKACLRLADALAGMGQHMQAASVYEAGLASDPFNDTLKSGLQKAQQSLVQDLLDGKTLNHRALPAPPTPERITLAPHNTSRVVLGQAVGQGFVSGAGTKPSHGVGLRPGQQYAVGWQLPAVEVIRALELGELGADGSQQQQQQQQHGVADSASSWRLPSLLLTPATVEADPALRDVYEYVSTQCNTQVPKRYLYRQLPDAARLQAWWRATAAAVRAVTGSGRQCRVLLLGAKAGLLAVAAARAGAVHVTCMEQNPYLAAVCHQLLLSNGLQPTSFTVISKHPATLKLGHDLLMICNCLIADLIDDGVLSGGLIPAVSHALDELLVRDEPVLVPAAVTVMAQAVAVRPAGCEVGEKRIDLSALDCHRWTPSQALPSPLNPSALLPLSEPQPVWHMPLTAVQKDMSAVAQLDVEMTESAAWGGVAVWADLQLFDDIRFSTAGEWRQQQQQQQPGKGTAGGVQFSPDIQAGSSSSSSSDDSSSSSGGGGGACIVGKAPASCQPAICWFEGAVPVKAGEVYPLLACHNTVRLAFTLKEADYQYLFSTDPSFPHIHFAAAADQPCLTAYYDAMKAAITRVATAKRQQQQQQMGAVHAKTGPIGVCVLDVGSGSGVLSLLAASAVSDSAAAAAGQNTAPTAAATVSGPAAAAAQLEDLHTQTPAAAEAASPGLAAAAAVASPPHPTNPAVPIKANVIGVELVAPLAAAAVHNVALNGRSADVSIVQADVAMLERGGHVPRTGVDVVVFDMFDAGLVGHQVLGMLEVIKSKLLDEGAQLVPASATLYAMGVEISTETAAAAWQQLSTKQQQQQVRQQQGEDKKSNPNQRAPVVESFGDNLASLDLSALEQFRWSGEPEPVLLDHLPHKQLTRPVKLFDFDFCAAPGTPYPAEGKVQLEIEAEGCLNAVVVWFDLYLAEGVSITSAPAAFTTGGRLVTQTHNSNGGDNTSSSSSSSNKLTGSSSSFACESLSAPCPAGRVDCKAIILHPAADAKQLQPEGSTHHQQQQQPEHHSVASYQHRHWGQSLHYLDHTAAVPPGAAVHLEVKRQGPKLTVKFLGGANPATTAAGGTNTSQSTVNVSGAKNSSSSNGNDSGGSSSSSGRTALSLAPAPRAPWLRSGAGIEDPAVWSVKKCQQLLAQMLQRAPGGKFPPIWNDLALMQLHAGSLGLDAAVVGAISQQLTMQEALSVAAGKQVAVSGLVMAEAAGLQPPLVWQ